MSDNPRNQPGSGAEDDPNLGQKDAEEEKEELEEEDEEGEDDELEPMTERQRPGSDWPVKE